MGDERRPPTDLHTEYVRLCRTLSGGRFTSTPSTFAIREFLGVKNGRQIWRLLEDVEVANLGWLTQSVLIARIDLMSRQMMPQPSCPQTPPTHSLTIIPGTGRLETISARGIDCTAIIFQAIVKGYAYKWLSDNEVEVPDLDLLIRSNDLDEIAEAEEGPYYMDTMMLRRIARWRGEHVPTPTAEFYDEEKPVKRERKTRTKSEPTKAAPRTDGAKLSGADRRKLRAAGLKAPYSAEDIARVLA